MSQEEIVRAIKALKHDLRLRFDPDKLVELYRLIDLLQ